MSLVLNPISFLCFRNHHGANSVCILQAACNDTQLGQQMAISRCQSNLRVGISQGKLEVVFLPKRTKKILYKEFQEKELVNSGTSIVHRVSKTTTAY